MKSGESRSLKEKLMKLEQKIMEYPGLQDFTGGVCQESILMAQKALEVAFPISYRWFLMTFGLGSFGDLEIFGLVEAEKGLQKKRGAPDLLFMTERLRSCLLYTSKAAVDNGEERILVLEKKVMEQIERGREFTR